MSYPEYEDRDNPILIGIPIEVPHQKCSNPECGEIFATMLILPIAEEEVEVNWMWTTAEYCPYCSTENDESN